MVDDGHDVLELAGSLGFLDEVYEQHLRGEAPVHHSWHAVLPGHGERVERAGGERVKGEERAKVPRQDARGSVSPLAPTSDRPGRITLAPSKHSPGIWPLVNAYRCRGHMEASVDPLGLLEARAAGELSFETWGFTDADRDKVIDPPGVHGMSKGTLAEIVAHLRHSYADTIGLEFMHITSPSKRSWLAERMETRRFRTRDNKERVRMLEHLVGAEGFERFCHVKYPGTKRFSLEGSEVLIPLLDCALTHASRQGAIEAVIGMAHRGRLTTLEMIMQRAARDLFAEFEDVEPEASLGGGDVKYHLGYSCDRNDDTGHSLHVSLSFNPSHLEAVDPVVLGRVRAKQARHGDVEHRKVVGILVHGDAAFAGQGLVAECLNLVSLPGYRSGGTVHVIVNNQVGFTASPAEQRSTPYCTDIAKMIECPIWHVNGEDLDAVAAVVEMAMEYRLQFGTDVVIDVYCYRKYGHNEMDEPGFTQPIMYERIQKMTSVVESYGQRLAADGVIAPDAVATMVSQRAKHLDAELRIAKAARQRPRTAALAGMWRGYHGGLRTEPLSVPTAVPRALLQEVAARMVDLPTGFTPHAKMLRLLEQRAQMGRGERVIDWGMAEMLAYGTLLWEGRTVRLSGQDSSRGTFSHRHAIITDFRNGVEHSLLGHLHPEQGHFRVYDSPLSEAGVLGFEFGYSLDSPDALVLWEAQFGDFANGAQVIIDQFIVASEDKWHRLSGITLLLPHGYEGQGPEHSSARLERFLQAAAEQNIQVAQPTSPAQVFHLFRRQTLSPWKKPLIVMTPKSLLRLPAATSSLDELTVGEFQPLIVDPVPEPGRVDRILVCSGRVYYDLAEERRKRQDEKIAIVRVEELYPWWPRLVTTMLAPFANARDIVWVQDEPANAGAASFVLPRLAEVAGGRTVRVCSRAESASPATGSHKAHVMEQEQILRAAFTR